MVTEDARQVVEMSEDEIKKAIEEIRKLRFRCRICGSFVIFPQCGKPFCPIHGTLDQDLITVEKRR
jgi:rRNA maturation endonuclease Nob1